MTIIIKQRQSNLAKSGIASRLNSPAGTIGLAIVCFGWRFEEPRSNTMCHCTPKCIQQMASKSVKRFMQGGTNVTDDRQTDHATEKCVGMDEIACAANT